jgi:hypothetical protein
VEAEPELPPLVVDAHPLDPPPASPLVVSVLSSVGSLGDGAGRLVVLVETVGSWSSPAAAGTDGVLVEAGWSSPRSGPVVGSSPLSRVPGVEPSSPGWRSSVAGAGCGAPLAVVTGGPEGALLS